MKRSIRINLTLILSLSIIAVNAQKREIDLLIYNARIYTVDKKFSIREAIAIKDGKIKETGSTRELIEKYDPKEKIDAKSKFIFPGFIDAHAHFLHYGTGLQTADLTGTTSWDEIVSRLRIFAENNKEGWLIGRGWDQNRWTIKEFPTKEKLDEAFPDRPVVLTRVDGHAVIANSKALQTAGIKAGMTLTGGQIEIKNGQLTGILIDNATQLVYSKIPEITRTQGRNALLKAQENCFAAGLTTIDDCGLDYREVLFIDSLQKKSELKMRIYAMLSDNTSNYNFLFSHGKIKTDHLNVRSFKVYADGALGSRGACLLQPYNDKPGWYGFLLSSKNHYDSVARLIREHGFQMCTHAIGDSGNRVILKIYGKYLKGKNDLRWRIEHAQVVNKNDLNLFNKYSIIPSVQPTHATSDMIWAMDRLGPIRIKGAYAYKQLMDENGWIPLGTDFPVEDIDPLKTFYAAVFRNAYGDTKSKGFQMENALSRMQALRGMTIWAAKSNFEEGEKGSLEAGKFADLVILDKDLMTIKKEDFFTNKVLLTVLNGEKVYSFKE